MNPRAFQQLALVLANGPRAVEYRTAISRAYYAVYHIGVEILENMGFAVSRGPGGHGEVQRCLSNCSDQEVMNVGSQLALLHHRRIQADYRLDRTDIENGKTAQAIVNQASEMIVILDRCRTEPLRTQIRTAIRNWKTPGQQP